MSNPMKKKFDRKKAVTFHLVSRSPYDKDAGKPGASKHVLRLARKGPQAQLPKDFPVELIETQAATAFDVGDEDPMLADMKARYKAMLGASSNSGGGSGGMDDYDDYDDDEADFEGDDEGDFYEDHGNEELELLEVMAAQAAQTKIKHKPEEVDVEDWDDGAELSRFLKTVGKDEGTVFDAPNAEQEYVVLRQQDAKPEDQLRLFGAVLPSPEEIDERFRQAVTGVAPPDELLLDPEFRRVLDQDDDGAFRELEELDDMFVQLAMDDAASVTKKADEEKEQQQFVAKHRLASSAAAVSLEDDGNDDDDDDDDDDDGADEEERIAQMIMKTMMAGGGGDGDFEIEEFEELDEGDWDEGDEGDEGEVRPDAVDDDAMLQRLLEREYGDEMIGGLSDEDPEEMLGEGEALLTTNQLLERGLADEDFKDPEAATREAPDFADFRIDYGAKLRPSLRPGQRELSPAELELREEVDAVDIRGRDRRAARQAEELLQQQREYQEALQKTKALLRQQREAEPELEEPELSAAGDEEEDEDQAQESAAGQGFLGLERDRALETRRQQRARERAERDRLLARDSRLNQEIDEHMEKLWPRQTRSQWDGESILSTYSNMYNHPQLLGLGGDLQSLRQIRQQQKQAQRERRRREEQDRQQERQNRVSALTARGVALEVERRLDPDWEHYEREDFDEFGQARREQLEVRVSPRIAGHDQWKQQLAASAAAADGKKRKGAKKPLPPSQPQQQAEAVAVEVGPPQKSLASKRVELSKKGMPMGVLQQHAAERRQVQDVRRREQTQVRMQQQRMMAGKYVSDQEMVSVRGGTVVPSRSAALPRGGPGLLQMPVPEVGIVNEQDEVIQESPEHMEWRRRMLEEERQQREQFRAELAAQGVALPDPDGEAQQEPEPLSAEDDLDEFDGNEPAASDDEGDEEEGESANMGLARSRQETKEEKRLRKVASKRAKQEQRDRKRQFKQEFKSVNKRQQVMDAHNKRNNIGFALP